MDLILIFYLTQFFQNIISTCYQYKVINGDDLHTKSLKSDVYFILKAHLNLSECLFPHKYLIYT